MPIYVACRCGQAFNAPDHFAGNTVACPACHQPLAIPGVAATGNTQLPLQNSSLPAYGAPQYHGQQYSYGVATGASTTQGFNWLPWAIGGGVAAALFALIVVAVLSVRSTQKSIAAKHAAAIAALHPWVSSDGLVKVGFDSPVNAAAETTQKTKSGNFPGIAYQSSASAESPTSVIVIEYRFPEGLKPAEAWNAFLTAKKERLAWFQGKRSFLEAVTRDFTFEGQPGWEFEFVNPMFPREETKMVSGIHIRERYFVAGERIYCVVVTQKEIFGQTYIPDNRFFESMKVLKTPESPTKLELKGGTFGSNL
jgi:hypothetical protein